MAVSADFQAQADAWGKQYDQQQDAEAAKQNPSAAQALPTSVFHWMDSNRFGRMTLSGIDTAVGTAENIWNSSSQVVRKGRDVASGGITGAANIEDAVQSAARTATNAAANSSSPMLQVAGTLGQEFMQHIENPIWSHAKESVLDFRDAVAVKDPTMSDDLTQAAAQLAIPYLGYSRILGGMMDVAKGAAARFGTDMAAGAATDATALQPHAMRTADLIALGRHTEGKLGEALRRIAPDGSALNAYINYLADNKNETEAQGRFKNVLDGLTANLIFTPLLHAAGITIKQGAAGMRYLVDNGVGSAGALGPVSRIAQRGSISARPITNNGSGESAASVEAQHRLAAERAANSKPFFITPDGKERPLLHTVDAVDVAAPKGHLKVQPDENGGYTILDRGGLPQGQARGLLARFMANLPEE